MTNVNYEKDFVEIIVLSDSTAVSLNQLNSQINRGETYYAYLKDYINCDVIDIFLEPFDDDNYVYGYFANIAFFFGRHHKSNFITIAEWREQQINSILDEN
jgi:hypothetical protein